MVVCGGHLCAVGVCVPHVCCVRFGLALAAFEYVLCLFPICVTGMCCDLCCAAVLVRLCYWCVCGHWVLSLCLFLSLCLQSLIRFIVLQIGLGFVWKCRKILHFWMRQERELI